MSLPDNEIISLLSDLRQQDYPLTVTQETADALVECMRRIMEAVQEDDRVFVRADYDLATSALCHPVGSLPRTNARRGRYPSR
jgi:predicted amino acid racemase